jgi:phospholipid/cholesterol/gamma-HCH transport system substrate-binding protein
MQQYTRLEISVGACVMLGALALAYLSLTLGGLRLGSGDRYPLTARFSSVGSLKRGDPVKIAGVQIGEVAGVELVDFNAQLDLRVNRGLLLPTDTIASIQSAGLLGDMYVSLSPGASDQDLQPGGTISRTEPAINVMELVAKYAFGAAQGLDETPSQQPGGAGGARDESAAAARSKHSPLPDPLE